MSAEDWPVAQGTCATSVHPAHTGDVPLHCGRSATRGCAEVVNKALALDTAMVQDAGFVVEAGAAVP